MLYAARSMSKSKQFRRLNLKSNLTSWGAINTVTVHHFYFFLTCTFFNTGKRKDIKIPHLIFKDVLGISGINNNNNNNNNNSKVL
jgi:hypothetical protein